MTKYKLILLDTDGTQYLMEVNAGDVFTAPALWDERVDGPIAIDAEKVGGYVRSGNALSFDPALKAAQAAKEKAQADKVKDAEAKKKARPQTALDLLASIKDKPSQDLFRLILEELSLL